MIRLPGEIAKDLCDSHLKPGRRDFLRIGGAGMLGMTLNNIFAVQKASAASGPPRKRAPTRTATVPSRHAAKSLALATSVLASCM